MKYTMKSELVIAIILMALAQPALVFAEGSPGTIAESSVNPDSVFWGIENALDQLSLALTFNDQSKAEKGIEIAKERLFEFEKMSEKGDMKAAERAKNSYDAFIKESKAAAKKITDNNKTREIEKQIELEKEVEHLQNISDNANARIKIKLETHGNLTAEQKALIESFIASMQNQTGSLKIEILQNKEKIKIKIKEKTNKSEEEIEIEVENLEGKHNLTSSEAKKERASDEIKDAKDEIAKMDGEIAANAAPDTATLTLRDNAKAKLSEAETAFRGAKYGEAYGLANAAKKLAEDAREKLEKSAEKEQKSNKTEDGEDEIKICAQVITPAKNKATGQCKDFPTPCDVPDGWEKVISCTSSEDTATSNNAEEVRRSAKLEEQIELFNENVQDVKRCKDLNISLALGGCILQKVTYDKRYVMELDSRTEDAGIGGCWMNKIHRFMVVKRGEVEIRTEGTCSEYNKKYLITIT